MSSQRDQITVEEQRVKSRYVILGVGSALVTIVGTLLPWVRVQGTEGFTTDVLRSGIHKTQDGSIAIVLAVAAVGVMAWYYLGEGWGLVRSLLVSVLGVVVFAGALGAILDPTRPTPIELYMSSAREGAYVTLIGGLGITTAGLLGLMRAYRHGNDEV